MHRIKIYFLVSLPSPQFSKCDLLQTSAIKLTLNLAIVLRAQLVRQTQNPFCLLLGAAVRSKIIHLGQETIYFTQLFKSAN